MNPSWRTSTVIALCQSMRESQDFSAMPILADALQDADCDNVLLLTRLREGVTQYANNVRLVAYIMSDETRAALEWFDNFVEKYELGYHENREKFWAMAAWDQYSAVAWHPICDYAKGFAETIDNARLCDGDYLTFVGNRADGTRATNPSEFWDNFDLLTGLRSRRGRGSSFSCSC